MRVFFGCFGSFESFKEFLRVFGSISRVSWKAKENFFNDFTPRLFYRVSLIRTVQTNQSCETYCLTDGPEANTSKGEKSRRCNEVDS